MTARGPRFSVSAQVEGYPEAVDEEEEVQEEADPFNTTPDEMDFWSQVQQELRRVIGGWAKKAGYSTNAGQALVDRYWKQFVDSTANQLGSLARTGASNMEVFQVLVNMGLNWYGAKLPFSVDTSTGGSGGGLRGGGGGGGPRGPTPDEIRASFDVDALADRVNQMSRMFLIQDHKDPRAVARQYVESIVRNPDQKLDFDTFVKGQLKQNTRWNVIFANKPEGLDEAQYIQRYVQQVNAVMGGDQGADQVSFELASLGAGQGGVEGRLERTRGNRSSSDYVNRFEDTIRGVRELLQ